MSSSRAFYCLPSLKKQKHDFHFLFFFVQCIIKQLLDSVFVISRIIKVELRVISRSLRLITLTSLTSTLIILDIIKTSSNNSLITECNIGEIRIQFMRFRLNFCFFNRQVIHLSTILIEVLTGARS